MNLYLHFPFCRRKCKYCALHSRVGIDEETRAKYVASLAARTGEFLQGREGRACCDRNRKELLSTVYFGGGSPALCALEPLFEVLAPYLARDAEFTVELHPLDVRRETLSRLKAGGVNRISMGVQSLDDAVLEKMGRMYSFHDAERAFALVKEYFDNAGIDLIAGFPGDSASLTPRHARLAKWDLKHASVYSIILEERSQLGALVKRGLETIPDDDALMDRIALFSRMLADLGLERYEISNYARPGFECRHNMAVWRGEDYAAFGEGAHGRLGLERTFTPPMPRFTGEVPPPQIERVSPEHDRFERTAMRLRTREGIDATHFPQWRETLDFNARQGLLSGAFPVYTLTPRGMEVCDAILEMLPM